MNEIKRKLTLHQPVTYQIKVPGYLDERWGDRDCTLTILAAEEGDGLPVTTLSGTLDQAALHGLLRRLYALGLPLISVTWVDRAPCNQP